jgi:ElaB/YqjD/DUF883 family membrane-anchored ribosome-binding protein
MQDKIPTGPVAMNDAAPLDDAQLTAEDQAAIAAMSSLGTDSTPAEASPSGRVSGRALPGRGHKMEILDNTIAALSNERGESPLVQMVKGWIDKAAAIAHVAVDKTASSVVPLAQAVSTAKDSRVSKAQDYKGTAAVAKDQWVGQAKAAIQDRPLSAIGIAALAGVAISLIFFSPSNSDSDTR